MPTPGQKQRQAESTGALIDALSEQFAKELERVLVRLKTKIRTLAQTLETNSDGRIVATRQNLARAVRLRADLEKLLVDTGYAELAQAAVDAPLDRLLDKVLSQDARIAVSKAGFDVNALAAMKDIRFADLLQVGSDAAVTLWRLVVDGVLGTRPVNDLVADLADVLDISLKRARTVYDTAVSTYSRQVAQLGTTGQPDELFFYVGPVDAKTREFCLERVGKVFSREEIEGMDNEQLPDVMLTGGGYNCRHMWSRVSSLDQELIDLWKTDQRQQGVQDRIDDLEAVAA